VKDRALFILDKLHEGYPKVPGCVGRRLSRTARVRAQQIQPDEITRAPWLVILTRMGATREEMTDILERVGRRW
jgi:hypothetical protein